MKFPANIAFDQELGEELIRPALKLGFREMPNRIVGHVVKQSMISHFRANARGLEFVNMPTLHSFDDEPDRFSILRELGAFDSGSGCINSRTAVFTLKNIGVSLHFVGFE